MKKEFKIDIEVYSEDIIKQVISDFSEVSEIKFSNGILEIFGESKEEIEEIFNEFMNYSIGLINEI